MEIEYNGKRDLFQVTPDTTFGNLLLQLRKGLAEYGQVVAELILDGEPLTEQREALLSADPVGSYGLLKVTGVFAPDMVNHILNGLSEAIDALQKKSSAIGRLVQQGHRGEALEHLDRFTGDLGAFADGIHHCYSFLKTARSSAFRPIDEDMQGLRALLERINEVIVSEEDVEFGDLLLYEVPDSLEAWRSLLDATTKALTTANHEGYGTTRGN